jgi:hypothetical protein
VGQIKTQVVTLRNGSTAVINAADFDPARHAVGTPKAKIVVKKKAKIKGRFT